MTVQQQQMTVQQQQMTVQQQQMTAVAEQQQMKTFGHLDTTHLKDRSDCNGDDDDFCDNPFVFFLYSLYQ
jgi:hypothetical protein